MFNLKYIYVTAFILISCLVKLSGYTIDGSTVTLTSVDRTDDNTILIQKFLDNQIYKKVVIQPGNNNASWPVKPLFFKHNGTELYFCANTALEAIPGGYPNKTDCVLSAIKLKNIKVIGESGSKIFMHKKEYADMEKAEWRSALYFSDCSDVKISGLTLADTGGDGIYLGASKAGYCSNVSIDNVVTDGCARNGLSAISVDGLTVTNSTFKNTKGAGKCAAHGPWAGIDLEPNYPGQILKNILIKNCLLVDNGRRGFLLHSVKLAGSKDIMNVSVKDCMVKANNNYGIQVSLVPGSLDKKSSVVFENCNVIEHNNWGIYIYNKAKDAGITSFINCHLKDNNITGKDSDIIINTTSEAKDICGNVVFDNVFVKQYQKNIGKPVLKIDGKYAAVENVSGKIRAVSGTLSKTGKTANIDVKIKP